ncbi:zf-HC2 domain-containing protein [Dubosiella newyorkensis]|uniref:zf-HC2 domain-containing protein n=2 Tax=Dubosiella newyorkensis TaxID=1862672 RepID=UPI0024BB2A00|nr:zf-HC2 domain-containing protein [Dubosiella newyorkensis]
MEENKLHILVKDLLPDYIDGLTSPETNKIIEEHLFQCSSCQKALERMKESPSVDDKINMYINDEINMYSF